MLRPPHASIHRSIASYTLAGLAAGLFLCSTAHRAFAQVEAIAQSRQHFQKAQQAYDAKDWPTYLAEVQATAALRPNHPTLVYAQARAHALNGQVDEAIHWLDVYADMGLMAEPHEDENLAAIHEDARFAGILEKLERNTQPISSSTEAFTLEAPELIPEGLAYDAKTQAFYVGGIHGKKVLRRNADGTVEEFVNSQNTAFQSIFGMVVDPETRQLWVGTAAVDQTPDADSAKVGLSQLNQIDIDSGRLKKQFLTTPVTRPHILNDLCLAPTGLYITDNQSGEIYHIATGSDQMALWIPTGRFASPQGITPSTKGDWLFLADYSTGIHRIDTETGESSLLEPGERTTLLGIDGLAYHKGTLIAIQNGVPPNRVIRIVLDESETSVQSIEVLEQHHPAFDEPTLGIVVNDHFYYIANSHWGQLEVGGSFRDRSALTNPTILKIALP